MIPIGVPTILKEGETATVLAVLNQLPAKLPDLEKFTAEIGAPSTEAAEKRLQRLRTRITEAVKNAEAVNKAKAAKEVDTQKSATLTSKKATSDLATGTTTTKKGVKDGADQAVTEEVMGGGPIMHNGGALKKKKRAYEGEKKVVSEGVKGGEEVDRDDHDAKRVRISLAIRGGGDKYDDALVATDGKGGKYTIFP